MKPLPRRLVTLPEGQFLERKSCWDHGRRRAKPLPWKKVATDVAETLVAFSNADGGELLVGLDDDGKVSGVPYPESVLKKILDAPLSRITPRLDVTLEVLRLRGQKVIRFAVTSSSTVHRTTSGRCLYRDLDRNDPRDAEEVRYLKALKRQTLVEHVFMPRADIDDLDPKLLKSVARKMKFKGDPVSMLSELRLVERTNGSHRVTLAALLLFAPDPGKWHARAGVDYIRFQGTERKTGRNLNIVKRERIEAPLAVLPQRVFEALRPHIGERHRLVDLFFEERMEYPEFAWQEAVVNAIAHRDYGLHGNAIEIHQFDDRIEFISPGRPVPTVRLETLRKGIRAHASRNPYIVRVLTALGFMKEVGEGVPRMHREMESSGLRPPEFVEEPEGFFNVTLRNTPVWDEETIKWLEPYRKKGLSQNQLRLLVFAREHGGHFTSAQYQKLVGADIYTASRDIKELLRKDIAVQVKKGGRAYRLTGGEVEVPKDFAAICRELFRKGSLSNADLRKIWETDRQTALRRANSLVEAGWLMQKGERRWMRYHAAPKKMGQP